MIRTVCLATTLLAGTLLPCANASAAVTINARVSQIVKALKSGSHFSQNNLTFIVNRSGRAVTAFSGIRGVRSLKDQQLLNDWLDEQIEGTTLFNGGPYKFTHSVVDTYFSEPPKSSSVFDGEPYKFTHSVVDSYFDDTGPENGDQRLLNEAPMYADAPAPSLTLPIPEPASWAMMIGGFALVGAAIRHRRAVLRSA